MIGALRDQPAAFSIFDRVLPVARSIASATSAPALEAAIRESATALLRAERCVLISVVDGRSIPHGVDGVSHTLLARAVETGRPVSTETPDTFELLPGGRAALAAPIHVHGKAQACLYVTHRQVGVHFADQERELAALIVTLAGAGYEHLADSETRFRSLAQGSSDVTTLVDARGIVRYQSAAVHTVFGLRGAGLTGRKITEWFHPDDVAEFRAVLADAVNGSARRRIECRVRHADGSYRFAESALTNLLDEPTVRAMVVNTRDITDRRAAADQLRVVEERERIARDLHDVVIQRLFAVGLGLDSLSAALPDAQAEQVIHAMDELHDTIGDIRGAIFSLRSDEPSRPLGERLVVVFDRAEKLLGFALDVRVAGEVDALPEPLHLHLLATVNEALSNVARHASATRAWVTITVAGNELSAVVRDDGCGLPAERRESGLANLRRRAEMVDGTMTTEPGPGGMGLELAWRVPLPEVFRARTDPRRSAIRPSR
jgi:PAS domain S-box-containing protein